MPGMLAGFIGMVSPGGCSGISPLDGGVPADVCRAEYGAPDCFSARVF
ncbi:hypothetical protein HMPREF3038_01551 [Akkermansia sp. KLE1797]|nr:hypothetical protein HMPREF3038_01551 [Akkermansia sp. KLE1797]KXU54040.1 hypothetical protein HMPREF3039_01705 [Akkermansia sp. KLE1798]KZA05524.1 hypothetical protein HMPREF1326_00699 [Akkermansia sp. KLE1605]